MPATPQKGGTVPESDKDKLNRSPQGATVLKGGVVPQSAMGRPSSPPEVLSNPETKQEAKVQQVGATGPTGVAQSPSQVTTTSPSPETQDYSRWAVLGLEIDTKDPLIQRELRVHPTSGEVVRVPVGKAAQAGEQPTPATDSQLREAGFAGPSPTPGSAVEGAATPAAATTPTSTTTAPPPPK